METINPFLNDINFNFIFLGAYAPSDAALVSVKFIISRMTNVTNRVADETEAIPVNVHWAVISFGIYDIQSGDKWIFRFYLLFDIFHFHRLSHRWFVRLSEITHSFEWFTIINGRVSAATILVYNEISANGIMVFAALLVAFTGCNKYLGNLFD